MSQVFTMPSLPPSKKNSKRICRNSRTGRPMILSQAGYATWERETAFYMGLTLQPMERACVRITYHIRSNRRRDLTNMTEGLMDALVVAGILPDDSWQYLRFGEIVGVRAAADKVTIELSDYENTLGNTSVK